MLGLECRKEIYEVTILETRLPATLAKVMFIGEMNLVFNKSRRFADAAIHGFMKTMPIFAFEECATMFNELRSFNE